MNNKKTKNGDLTIKTEVAPTFWGKVNAFSVYVSCDPVFKGTDKELMQRVCDILTNFTNGNVELKTQNVVSAIWFENCHIREIVFQVITPLEPLWYV